uniref:Uncharacterized protein n=1 Tax=Meloidogyne incognita TaxID=6306 RepID=A0A914NUK2_MELIC
MGVQFYVFQPQQCLQEHPKKECSYFGLCGIYKTHKNRSWTHYRIRTYLGV